MFRVKLLFVTLVIFPSAQAWIKAGFWYSGSEFPVPDINSALFTHLICAVAHINLSNYELSISSSDDVYMSTFTEIVRQKNPSIITLLSTWGGEANSSKFFEMVSTSSRRKSFIESSIKVARQHGFLGLDLFGVLPNTPINMTNMGAFLDEWREAVNSEPKNSNTSPLFLTMGARYSPTQNFMTYPIDSIKRNVDWVHLMSYDYYLPSKDNFTGAHAALYDPSSHLNTDYGIKEWIKRGLPANKLVLGLPYHGYAWTLVNPDDNTIGSPAKGLAITADGSMSYRYIMWFCKSYGVKPLFNSTYVTNYMKIGSSWIGFDDIEVVKIKVSYAKKNGLLGYSVFQVPNDDENWVLSRAAGGEEEDQKSKQSLLVIVLPTVFVAILLSGTAICCLKRKIIMPRVRRETTSGKRVVYPNLQDLTFNEIKTATDNFACESKLGEGGFGPVYKGKLGDGQEVAVKRLSRSSQQGAEEFKNEVALAARLQHVNLVKLLGFCIEGEEKMLIYEYMPNKSLDTYLFDPVKRWLLDWEKRVQIIEGISQGLLYLQEYSIYTVIHRDLKASNILLDNYMKPKISDFGIARIFQRDEIEANTQKIVGTYGYVPPEYVKRGMYSRKYDVFSFGVLLLQIISGKKTSNLYGVDKNLTILEHAYELWRNDHCENFMDPSLNNAGTTCKLKRYMQVALLCVQERWEDRPTMLEVSSMLKNENEIVPTPGTPAFSTNQDEEDQQKYSSSSHAEVYSANMETNSELVPR
ncbi:G-type lectin S-receptor-like serine threonine-kinase [Olea europaea subsp. europaea]|uniref:non-specific serine/threonine protein kinase n=2 Tax=Olea europaea subsp. europaea TaxID=158383 RepID=A0A8S0TNV5_OLEEU|nr:G-type lectin S-receptor-like serine threonine-kinase [Olea europaea subsp. europaea]